MNVYRYMYILYIAEGQLHLKWHRTIFGPTEPLQQNTRLVQNSEARGECGSPKTASDYITTASLFFCVAFFVLSTGGGFSALAVLRDSTDNHSFPVGGKRLICYESISLIEGAERKSGREDRNLHR